MDEPLVHPFRVAELLGSLSLACDLADGFAVEKCLRTAVIATRLAKVVTDDPAVHATTYWASLLRFLGCTAFAHEENAMSAGDDIGLRRALAMVDFGSTRSFASRAIGQIGAHAPLPARARALSRLLGDPSAPARHAQAQCEVGTAFARAIGIAGVPEVLALRDERWDGRGPRALSAEGALPLPARIVDVADVAELFAWHHGTGEAMAELARRSGGQLDPALVKAATAEQGMLWEGVFDPSVWELYLATEPGQARLCDSADEIGRVLEAWSLFSDLTSVFTLGHSSQVGRLAESATEALGLPPSDQRLICWAGFVHDLGRVAIPNGIWEKPGPLTPFERERVRLHSQHTETILRLAPALAPIADLASAVHERSGGKGYHRRLPLEREPLLARVLAVADVYVALRSHRPHRAAFSLEATERELQSLAREGTLDSKAVAAVLDAAGHVKMRRTAPKALTEREREVVRLVAIGRTNKEIGTLLGMSPRTAQKHVMNIYAKLGLESRAGLALFAVEHGLLESTSGASLGTGRA